MRGRGLREGLHGLKIWHVVAPSRLGFEFGQLCNNITLEGLGL